MDIFEIVLLVAFYLLVGMFVLWIFEDSGNEPENPLWPPLIVVLWPVSLVILFVICVRYWIDDIKEYYRSKEKEN